MVLSLILLEQVLWKNRGSIGRTPKAIPCFSIPSLAKHTRRGTPTRACPERSEESRAGLVLNEFKELGWGSILTPLSEKTSKD
jgi:hypothetical protein